MTPLVTIALTTLNRTTYLREALESLLAQDYPALDILVSDNGSRDHTPQLAREIAAGDPRVRFRRNETTVPIHEHFTQCLFAAHGEFFILFSDDDRVNPSFVSELVGVATRHPDVNVVVPANTTIDEHGNVLEEYARPNEEVFDAAQFLCDWLYKRTPSRMAALVSVMGRTAVLRRFGGYQAFARGQNLDNLLFLQAAITGRVGFASRASFHWRVYGRSYGTTTKPRQIAVSAKQFVQHLRRDPETRAALATLPAGAAEEIIDGVRLTTAREFLYRIGFYENPLRWQCIRQLMRFWPDPLYAQLVLREYWRRWRGSWSSAQRRASTAT